VNRLLLTDTCVMGVASAELWSEEPDLPGLHRRDLVPLVESGAIDPPIGQVFALGDAAAAIRELDERRALGRVLLRMRWTARSVGCRLTPVPPHLSLVPGRKDRRTQQLQTRGRAVPERTAVRAHVAGRGTSPPGPV
jgi:hypothetical protein